MVLLHKHTLTHRRFDTQKPLHTNAFTHRRFYTQTQRFYTQTLVHTDEFYTKAFTHRRFYTQTLLHADAFYTCTHAFTHKRFYTQTRCHTNAFTHRRFCTQMIFTHAHIYKTVSYVKNFVSSSRDDGVSFKVVFKLKPHFFAPYCPLSIFSMGPFCPEVYA